MGTNYIAPIWRMPENTNKDKLSNYSISLSSGSDYISMGSVPNLFIGSWSISFWFKAPSVGQTNGTIISRYRSANKTGDLEITSSNGQIYVETGGGFPSTGTNMPVSNPPQIRSVATTLDDGNWHHIAFSLDYTSGTSTRSLYVDGSLDISDSTTTPAEWVSQTENLLFGLLIPPSNSVYNGSINQVSIFDYTISESQVTYLYNLNNPMVISGGEPVAYYPLGDNSNPNADAGYPNISVGADSVFNFNAANSDKITGTANLISGNESRSISFWYKTTATVSQIPFSLGGPTDLTNGSQFAYSMHTPILGAIYGKNSSYDTAQFTVPATNDGYWHHLVVTYDQSSLNVYIDGNLEATPSLPSLSYVTSAGFTIGAWSIANNRKFDGEISNVQVWNIDLTSTEITTLYNNGQPLMTGTQPQAANLKAWYKLNQYDSYWDLGGNGKWTFNNAALN